ncbi:PE domain-containing protein [Nocardia amamiensis]|uniref:PE domain-containing protein n=1 Tax=Nocardia amamiensis TaxID=404578 RepID=A0ABS0CVE6_9NOCA|nr:PE domain-containing protein [Nocardia amamiensis]MBF6300562.1 PE domain-containing protein [Nocardia amamiensis]
MFFAINNPGQITTIGAQLSGETADMIAAMGVTAPASVPLPPGIDDVSRDITEGFLDFAVKLYDKTVQGAVYRAEAAPHLPAVEVSYSGEDGAGSSRVLAHGSEFGK